MLCLTHQYVQGWNMAFMSEDQAPPSCKHVDATALDRGLQLKFLDGTTWTRISSLSKPVRDAVDAEKHVLSVDSPRFIHGQGIHT